jgi:hypothetical protein
MLGSACDVLAPVATRFGFNTLHFLLFSYPAPAC